MSGTRLGIGRVLAALLTVAAAGATSVAAVPGPATPRGQATESTISAIGGQARHVAPGAGEPVAAVPLSAAGEAVAKLATEKHVKLDREVLERLDDKGVADFWVDFSGQADLSGAARIEDWAERGRYVHQRLVETSRTSQSGLATRLSLLGGDVTSFWIANSMFVRGGDHTMVNRIVSQPGIAEVRADRPVELPDPVEAPDAGRIQAVEWGLADIRADRVWDEFGTRGDGIVVGSIDTGVAYTHPALVGQYRGNVGGGFDHNYNWWDPSGICPTAEPCDNNNHGTHTTGTMVGDDGAGNQIGVAPGAQWIAAKGCESGSCSREALLSAGQFMLAPTDLAGGNPRPDRRPHIVNNSWSGGANDSWYDQMVAAWVAAGIFPVFANGNAGSACDTAGSPADGPDAYAVGAHDSAGKVAGFSSRGPGRGEQIRPNISAPGVAVRSSVPGGYALGSGTSMAAPHVAGTVGLMWSASGHIGDIPATRAALDLTAVDSDDLSCGGTAGNNNVYGQGRLDALDATREVAIDSGITGTVTDADSGEPLAGVTVALGAGRTRTTGADGRYTVRLTPGTYTLEFSRFGHLTRSVPDVVVPGSEFTTVDVQLSRAPAGTIAGTVTDAVSGHSIPGVTIEVRNTPAVPIVETGSGGGYATPRLPVGRYELVVTSRVAEPVTVEASVTADTTTTVDVSLQPFISSVQRVSVASDGSEGNAPSGLGSTPVAMSADGRYVAFHSEATNLADQPVGADQSSVYVHDRQTGVTELVSVSSTGEAANASSWKPSISADGRYVAFASSATNLSTSPATRMGIYVHDRVAGTTERVSVSPGGEPANDTSDDPAISGDGRYVAFHSYATNLVAEDSQATCPQGSRCGQIYLRDRATGSVELLSRHNTGSVSNSSDFTDGSTRISPDGRYVVWQSHATNLVDDETNPGNDIFLHDRATGVTEWVSVLPTQGDLLTQNSGPEVSPDGRYVAYTRGLQLAALYDRATGQTELLTAPAQDGEPAVVVSIAPVVSSDGRTVVFAQFAFEEDFETPVPSATGIFILDRTTRQIGRLVENPDIDAAPVARSTDGRFVAVAGFVPAPDDTNGHPDVFVVDRDFDADAPQARYATWNLSVQPPTPLPGQPVEVTANVKNVGDRAGTRSLALRVDGVAVDTASTRLDPGESRELSWTVSREEGFTYRVDVAHLRSQFRVQSGTMNGAVTDANDQLPADATVTATNGGSVRTVATEAGAYQLDNLQIGRWTVTVRADAYVTATFDVDITADGQRTMRDVALRTGVVEAVPGTVTASVVAGSSTTAELTVANAGSAELTWNAFAWNATTQEKPSILVYADDRFHRAPDTYLDRALRRLGLDYTLIYGDAGAGDFGYGRFESALTGGDWDLVIFSNEWLGGEFAPLPTSLLDALNARVTAGGRLIVYERHLRDMASHPLWTNVGVSYVSDSGRWEVAIRERPDPVHWWLPGHPLVAEPLSVPEFTDLVHEGRPPGCRFCTRYGNTGVRVRALDGFTAIGGSTEEPAADVASLVLGNNGRTLFRGFADGHNEADLNLNGVADGVELWINSIVHIGGTSARLWLSAAGSGRLAAGGEQTVTLSIDATNLPPGTYTGSVELVTNAARRPRVTIPVSVTVTQDTTGPDLTVTGVVDGTTYGDSESLQISWSASDPSGVGAVEATLDGKPLDPGELPLYPLALGGHTAEVTAVDRAGNATTVSITFTTRTSYEDVGALITRFRAEGRINLGTAQELLAKLNSAALLDRLGQEDLAVKQLNDFKKILYRPRAVPDAQVREVLNRDADALITDLR